MQMIISAMVSYLGRRQASSKGTASRKPQHIQRIPSKVFFMLAESLTLGKGKFGTGSWRKEQRGSQPSLTSNTSSLSGGTWALTC